MCTKGTCDIDKATPWRRGSEVPPPVELASCLTTYAVVQAFNMQHMSDESMTIAIIASFIIGR